MWNNLFFLYANFLAHVYMFIKVFYVADEFVFMENYLSMCNQFIRNT